VEKLEGLSCLIGVQNGTATLKNSMKIPQKIKNRTTMLLLVLPLSHCEDSSGLGNNTTS